MITYSLMKKEDFKGLAKTLFEVLANNMDKIAPTGHPREDDFKVWYEDVSAKVKNDETHFALATDDESGEIVAFFQHHTTKDSFVMDEFQIASAYHGRGNVFRNMYGFLFDTIGTDYLYVEAAANKLNSKSIGVLGTLGLKIVGELHNGSCVSLRGSFDDLLKWYHKK